MTEKARASLKKVTRIGVYGAYFKDGKILLIRQKSGPYADKFDFPGGGIEFGESPVEALRREFVEELGMGFKECTLLDNMTAIIEVPDNGQIEQYQFFQIGMIYEVKGLYTLEENAQAEFEHLWRDLRILKESECSSFLWQYLLRQ